MISTFANSTKCYFKVKPASEIQRAKCCIQDITTKRRDVSTSFNLTGSILCQGDGVFDTSIASVKISVPMTEQSHPYFHFQLLLCHSEPNAVRVEESHPYFNIQLSTFNFYFVTLSRTQFVSKNLIHISTFNSPLSTFTLSP